jgi:hypothetical protein
VAVVIVAATMMLRSAMRPAVQGAVPSQGEA